MYVLWWLETYRSNFRHFITIFLGRLKRKCWWFTCIVYLYNINKRRFINAMCFHSIPCMALQPFWVLASLRRRLHSFLSSARLLHPLIPMICDVSLRTTSSHLFLGYPTCLILRNFPLRNFFGILLSTILIIWKMPRAYSWECLNQVAYVHKICYKWLAIEFKRAKHNFRIFKG